MTFSESSGEPTAHTKMDSWRRWGIILNLAPIAVGSATGYFTANGINNDRIRCHGDKACLVGKSSEAAADTAGVIAGLAFAGVTALAIGAARYDGSYEL